MTQSARIESFLHFFVCTNGFKKNFSKTCGTEDNEALSNYQLAEDISMSTLAAEFGSLCEESDDQQNLEKVENFLRTKRDEHKRDINLPPGYSIYNLPKPDGSPMPAFVYLNISKILVWNEFDEVMTLPIY